MTKFAEGVARVDQVLGPWLPQLGDDFPGYRNHVHRVIRFCLALRACDAEEREKVVLAACFHDLGIWTHGTFDYLAPSISLANEHLERNGLGSWIPEIGLMIERHHGLRRHRDGRFPLVEAFREADLIDLSFGIVRFGLSRSRVGEIRARFPDAGFHRRLMGLATGRVIRHPLSPLPMLRW